MGMSIDEATLYMELYKRKLFDSVSDLDKDIEAYDIAIDTMHKYKKVINDYETLIDSLEKSGASFKVCSKEIDEFCINTMRGILCDYYADVLYEEVEDATN